MEPTKLKHSQTAFGFTLVERFCQVVAAVPDKKAFVGEQGSYSYSELDILSDRLASAIIDSVEPGNLPVGLIMDQGLHLVVSILAVLKAGKCYIPIDCETPKDRLVQISEDSNCAAIISDELNHELSLAVASQSKPVLLVDDQQLSPSEFEPVPVDGNDMAYIIFTSGSTGVPKGVIQNHKSVLHSTYLFTNYFRIRSNDRQSLLYTPGVFGSQRDTFNALLNGATLFHFPLRKKGLPGLADWIESQRITIYCSVASVFRRMIDGLKEPRVFDSVRLVKSGGEATYWEDVDRFSQHFVENCELFCGFSMTETNLVTQNFVRPGVERSGPRVPLGYPVENTEILVLDDKGSIVPAGTIGQIAIRSKYISPGYFGKSELNAQRFSRERADPDVILYKTGDMGRQNVDGSLEFQGREDFQVKIRGFRVDILEVETALNGIPEIAEAAVVAQNFSQTELRLIAYIVFKAEKNMCFESLNDTLSRQLAKYMLPSHYTFLEALPLTTNGKIDRKRLPRLFNIPRTELLPFIEPKSNTEQQLVKIWEHVLGVIGVGTGDDFFKIGGDSLNAAQLLIDVDTRFGVSFDAADIMDEVCTVAKMAQEIDQRNPDWMRITIADAGTRTISKDIDFVEFQEKIPRTYLRNIYYIDRRTGLRRTKPFAKHDGIAINSMGFRGPDISFEKPPSTKRIAFLGSSGTFDPCVTDNTATWPHQTCALLNERSKGMQFEYINAGMNGYNIQKARLMYKEFVAPLQPDLVVICINDINVATAYAARELGVYNGVHFRHSKLAGRFSATLKIEKNIVALYRLLFAFSERNRAPMDPAKVLNKSKCQLESIVTDVLEDGRNVLLVENGRRLRPYQTRMQQYRAAMSQVVYLPYLSIPGYFRMQERHLQNLAEISDATGCLFKDFSDIVPGDPEHFADSSHFSDRGSKVFAEAVSEAIEELA